MRVHEKQHYFVEILLAKATSDDYKTHRREIKCQDFAVLQRLLHLGKDILLHVWY